MAPVSQLSSRKIFEEPKKLAKEIVDCKIRHFKGKKENKENNNTTVALWQKLYTDYWTIKEKRDEETKKHTD